jgi:hypothetical protein
MRALYLGFFLSIPTIMRMLSSVLFDLYIIALPQRASETGTCTWCSATGGSPTWTPICVDRDAWTTTHCSTGLSFGRPEYDIKVYLKPDRISSPVHASGKRSSLSVFARCPGWSCVIRRSFCCCYGSPRVPLLKTPSLFAQLSLIKKILIYICSIIIHF